VGVLLRSLVGLETGGGTEFFGEPQLDVTDLMRTTPAGSTPDAIGDFLTSRSGRALQREIVRGVFGLLRKRL
jgi:hypothetical protein